MAEETPGKVSDGDNSTDEDSDFEDNIPLSAFTPSGSPKQMLHIPVCVQHCHTYSSPDDDMHPESGADHSFQGLLAKAIKTIENVINVTQHKMVTLHKFIASVKFL